MHAKSIQGETFRRTMEKAIGLSGNQTTEKISSKRQDARRCVELKREARQTADLYGWDYDELLKEMES